MSTYISVSLSEDSFFFSNHPEGGVLSTFKQTFLRRGKRSARGFWFLLSRPLLVIGGRGRVKH